MRITGVVFDMDGLMLDTEPIYKVAWQQAAVECGFELDDATYSTLVGRSVEACDSDLLSRFGPALPMSRFRARRKELWRTVIDARGVSHKPGLLPLLDYLRLRNIPVA